MSTEHSFGTAINCIDGRTQQPVADWVKKTYKVEYVDMVTEPGPDKSFSQNQVATLNALKAKVNVSVTAHHSRVVAIAGHHNCAANPVTKDEHQAQVRTAARAIAAWGMPVTVAGLWVGPDWKAEPVVIIPAGSP